MICLMRFMSAIYYKIDENSYILGRVYNVETLWFELKTVLNVFKLYESYIVQNCFTIKNV